MLKPIVLVGALLTLGCFKPAHAGAYRLQNDYRWSIGVSAPSRNAYGTLTVPDTKGAPDKFDDGTAHFEWEADNQFDYAQPAKVTANFIATSGDCNVAQVIPGNLARDYISGGFTGRFAVEDTPGVERHDGFELPNQSTGGFKAGSSDVPPLYFFVDAEQTIKVSIDMRAFTYAKSFGGTVLTDATIGYLNSINCVVYF